MTPMGVLVAALERGLPHPVGYLLLNEVSGSVSGLIAAKCDIAAHEV